MRIVDIDEAKTHLTRLVTEAGDGEPFVIAVDGKPLVKVVAVDTPASGTKRRLGSWRGKSRFRKISTASAPPKSRPCFTAAVNARSHASLFDANAPTALSNRPAGASPHRKLGITWSP